MNNPITLTLPKTYCPLLITPDFTMPDEDFVPFEQYLGGCFLFHLDQEYVVMDTLGREIQRVRAQSASLKQSDPTESDSEIHISLHYTLDDSTNSVNLCTCPAPKASAAPQAPNADYKVYKEGFILHRYGVMDAQDNKILPAKYQGFIRDDGKNLTIVKEGPVYFSNGFFIAYDSNNGGYIYLDKENRTLIPFIRSEEGRTLVHCKHTLKKISRFDNGIFFAVLWDSSDGERYVIMNSSGRCLGDRTWNQARYINTDLFQTYSKKDEGWTFLRRDGSLHGAYYPTAFLTPNGSAFVKDKQGEIRCIVPFGTDPVTDLHWQDMKEAEPGLLWAWRDGRHELIDCRKNHMHFLCEYAAPIAKAHDVSWQQRSDGLYALTAHGKAIRMTQNEFRDFIDYLQKSCGLRRNFASGLDRGSYLFGFEGGRIHAPFDVQTEHESKTVSLLINYRKAEDGFDVSLIADGKPCPSVPPAEDLKDERIDISERTRLLIAGWHSDHWDQPFCDYLKEDLDKYAPESPNCDSDDYPLDTTRV